METLETDLTTSLANISEQLTAVSGKAIVINADTAIQLLAQYQDDTLPLHIQLSNAGGDLAFRDSDADGLSDFDEVYVFNTNPNQASTDGGLTDGEKSSTALTPPLMSQLNMRTRKLPLWMLRQSSPCPALN
jgi:hypothetical protein